MATFQRDALEKTILNDLQQNSTVLNVSKVTLNEVEV